MHKRNRDALLQRFRRLFRQQPSAAVSRPKPDNDLSRGFTTEDVVNTVILMMLQTTLRRNAPKARSGNSFPAMHRDARETGRFLVHGNLSQIESGLVSVGYSCN